MNLPSATSCHLRPILAMLAVTLLSLALVANWGFYSPTAMVLVLYALLLALGACSLPGAAEEAAPVFQPPWLVPLVLLALLLSGLAAWDCRVIYEEKASALKWMQGASWAGFAGIASLLLHPLGSRPWTGLLRVQMLVLFLAGALVRICAVEAVPAPPIDVYVALRDAPGHWLNGHNPYRAPYDWPYNTTPASYDVYPFYPPLPFVLCLPFRAVGLDVRYANVAFDLLAAGAIFWTGRCRGQALLGGLLAGTYLHLPRVPFLIEQAWYEPMLAGLIGSGLLLVERGRRLGWFLLGLAATGKQYGPLMLPSLWRAHPRRWRSLLWGTGLAAGTVLLPFLLWDPSAFLHATFLAHLERPMRTDSLALRNGLHEMFDLTVPGPLVLGLAAVLVGWVTWRTAQGTAAALWLGTTLFIFFLAHKQAYFNYFYLCEYLLLLGIAGLAPCRSRPAAGN